MLFFFHCGTKRPPVLLDVHERTVTIHDSFGRHAKRFSRAYEAIEAHEEVAQRLEAQGYRAQLKGRVPRILLSTASLDDLLTVLQSIKEEDPILGHAIERGVECEGLEGTTRQERIADFHEYVRKHAEVLLAGLRKDQYELYLVDWRMGFFDRVRMTGDWDFDKEERPPKLAPVVAHFLRLLLVHPLSFRLAELELADENQNCVDLIGWYGPESLQEVQIWNRPLDLGPLRCLPGLKRLSCLWDNCLSLVSQQWPQLETLLLTGKATAPTSDLVKQVVHAAPRLRHLGLTVYEDLEGLYEGIAYAQEAHRLHALWLALGHSRAAYQALSHWKEVLSSIPRLIVSEPPSPFRAELRNWPNIEFAHNPPDLRSLAGLGMRPELECSLSEYFLEHIGS